MAIVTTVDINRAARNNEVSHITMYGTFASAPEAEVYLCATPDMWLRAFAAFRTTKFFADKVVAEYMMDGMAEAILVNNREPELVTAEREAMYEQGLDYGPFDVGGDNPMPSEELAIAEADGEEGVWEQGNAIGMWRSNNPSTKRELSSSAAFAINRGPVEGWVHDSERDDMIAVIESFATAKCVVDDDVNDEGEHVDVFTFKSHSQTVTIGFVSDGYEDFESAGGTPDFGWAWKLFI